MADVFHFCETCREQVVPDAPDTVRAVEMRKVVTMATVEYVEGLGVFFHEGCYPNGSPLYNRKS